MAEYVTTHEQLLKLNGRKVDCRILGDPIYDARISVNPDNISVFVCHSNPEYIGLGARNKYEYPYSWLISCKDHYEDNPQGCTHIILIDENEKEKEKEKEKERVNSPEPHPLLTKKELVALEILKAMISHSAIDYGWSVHTQIRDGVDKSFEVAEVFLKKSEEEKK